MKHFLWLAVLIISCSRPSSSSSSADADAKNSINIQDTWLLVSGMKIKGSDTTYTDYTTDQKVLKIINDTHFSFIRHDLSKGQDSSTNVFAAGAGTYDLNGTSYKEHLEFCSYRPWEGNDFEFEMTLQGDTLIQTGRERIESLGVDQIIQETYVRSGANSK